ncbi:MAG: hypothetical protein KKH29_01165, partial [Candidatus Omnitrophica bacterium]|nr:hypothetical protein [Candidatus Omnitrophota bacterium]
MKRKLFSGKKVCLVLILLGIGALASSGLSEAVTFRAVDDMAVDDDLLVSGEVGIGEGAPSGD